MKNSKPVPYDYFLTMRFWKEDLEHYLLYRECAQEDLEKTTWEPYRYFFLSRWYCCFDAIYKFSSENNSRNEGYGKAGTGDL